MIRSSSKITLPLPVSIFAVAENIDAGWTDRFSPTSMQFLQSEFHMVLRAVLVFRGVLVLYRTIKRLPQVCEEGYPRIGELRLLSSTRKWA